MIRVRRVDDVAIVDWSHKDVATVVPRIRALVDAREASHVLLNMAEVETLKGEGLETLTEALTVCEDGGCGLGMYAVNTYLTKLLDIMNLHEVMPANLGGNEAEALARVRANGVKRPAAVRNGGGESAELAFDPQEAPVGKPPAKVEPVLEFEFDEPAPKAASPQRAAPSPALSAPTIKFDKSALHEAPSDEPDDLLAISWTDVVAQGIVIGGPGARELMQRAMADASASGAADAASAARQAEVHAAQRPTKKIPPPRADDLEIEIDDVPARPAPVAEPPKPREFKTEVIQAFELKDDKKKIEESSDDTESLQVDFGALRPDEPALGETGDETAIFVPEPGQMAWSPVDDDDAPPSEAPAPPVAAPRTQTPPAPLPSRPAVPPARPAAAAAQPIAPPPQRQPQAARLSPPPPVQPTRPPTPVQGTPTQPPLQVPAPAMPGHAVAAPGAPQAPPPQPALGGGFDAGDETVMFQPDGLLAEVLAAVGPQGQPESVAPGATTFDLDDAPAAAPAPAPAPAPVQAAPAPRTDAHEELRQFLRDHAIVSELHLRVLERFSREGVERILARTDVQSGVGGSAAAVTSIIEDFVQGRLLRRRRSPRVRGGTGFLYSPSPRTRNAVTRLMRLYEDGTTRAEVLTWIQAAARAGAAG